VRAPARALVCCVALSLCGAGPPRPRAGVAEPKRAELLAKLEARLARLSAGLEGTSGYLVRDLSGGETIEHNADAIFPAASTIKLPVLLELFRRAQEGGIDLDRPVPIDPKARVEGGGVLETWSEPYPTLSARHLAVLMMDFSDNYATNLLIDLVGMESVGRRLKTWGFRETLLRRKMIDVEAARAGRENVSTPREMVLLLERLYGGQLLDEPRTSEALAIMKRNTRGDRLEDLTPIKRAVPPGVEAADKEGDLPGVRCASGIVFVPSLAPGVRPFAISVMTAHLKDDAAGNPYITDVTRAAYDYFATLASSSEFGRRMAP
jgi:beta-lactamase class A